MSRLKVSIFGAGKIGTALAVTLSQSADFSLEIVDRSEEALDTLRSLPIDATLRTFRHPEDLPALLSGRDVAVAAVPEAAVPEIARAAAQAKVHYLDFSCAVTQTREALAELSSQRAVLTGCGVSPGMIGNIACGLLEESLGVTDLTIRVGAVPRFPTNRLGYGQIWNVDGLIDEYTRPSAAIRDGRPVMLTPLEEHGKISVDGVNYEEFITSGGVGDLSIFSEFALKNVTFKTIRYPGHLDYMRFLLDDLGLRSRRDMLRSLLCNGLPIIEDDVLLLMVTVRGSRARQPTERTACYRFSPDAKNGSFNALTSAATGYAATLLSLLQRGDVAASGYIEHHHIDTRTILSSDFLKPLLDPQ